ncbi:hypothetical protein GJ744_006304 [Endocarpon pusillum]|uniref:Uncharacterized protein n=1 Tax=Endocarpon pusillum TaxID=364733 RepID=A0A8H7DYD0_9EURO|nr:hypothetical protein GJ744_006304 [Endocarpon pusillum]
MLRLGGPGGALMAGMVRGLLVKSSYPPANGSDSAVTVTCTDFEFRIDSFGYGIDIGIHFGHTYPRNIFPLNQEHRTVLCQTNPHSAVLWQNHHLPSVIAFPNEVNIF